MGFGDVDHEAEAAKQAEIASEVTEEVAPEEVSPVTPAAEEVPQEDAPQEAPAEPENHSAPVAPSVEDEAGNAEPVSGALIEQVGDQPDAEPVSPVAPAPPEPTVTVKRVGDEAVNIAVAGFQIDLTETDTQDEVPESVAALLDGESDYVEVVA